MNTLLLAQPSKTGRRQGSKTAARSAIACLRCSIAIECRGKQVHDANIVATMSMHGIETLVTLNVDDFARFTDRIEICSLTSELSG